MVDDIKQELLTPSEVASLWGTSRQTVVNQCERGILRGFIINPGSIRPRWRIYADSVREVMKLDASDKQSIHATTVPRSSAV